MRRRRLLGALVRPVASDLRSRRGRQHSTHIAEHHRSLRERLGPSTDLRVSLFHYFLEISRKLERPKIIELRALGEGTEPLTTVDVAREGSFSGRGDPSSSVKSQS